MDTKIKKVGTREEVFKGLAARTAGGLVKNDIIEKQFTKEGQKRFKPLFSPAKKVARKLSARLSF